MIQRQVRHGLTRKVLLAPPRPVVLSPLLRPAFRAPSINHERPSLFCVKAPKKRNRFRINRHLIAGVRSLEARCIGRFYTDQLAAEVHLMPLQGVNLALPQTRRQGEKHGKECRGVALRKLPVRLLQQGLRVDPREVFCGLARKKLDRMERERVRQSKFGQEFENLPGE